MSRQDDIRCMIDQLEDNIACAEHDEEMDGGTSYDIDSALCRLADLQIELDREMEGERTGNTKAQPKRRPSR